MARPTLIISIFLACLPAIVSARLSFPSLDRSARNAQVVRRELRHGLDDGEDFWGERGFWGDEEEDDEPDEHDDFDGFAESSITFDQHTLGSDSHAKVLLARTDAKKAGAVKWTPPQVIIPPNMNGRVRNTLKCNERTRTCTGGITVWHKKRQVFVRP